MKQVHVGHKPSKNSAKKFRRKMTGSSTKRDRNVDNKQEDVVDALKPEADLEDIRIERGREQRTSSFEYVMNMINLG